MKPATPWRRFDEFFTNPPCSSLRSFVQHIRPGCFFGFSGGKYVEIIRCVACIHRNPSTNAPSSSSGSAVVLVSGERCRICFFGAQSHARPLGRADVPQPSWCPFRCRCRCSVCLSVFCEFSPVCTTCGTRAWPKKVARGKKRPIAGGRAPGGR